MLVFMFVLLAHLTFASETVRLWQDLFCRFSEIKGPESLSAKSTATKLPEENEDPQACPGLAYGDVFFLTCIFSRHFEQIQVDWPSYS